VYEKINYLLVGLFVVLFSAMAFYLAFWLAKEDFANRNSNEYIIYFNESVDGLHTDATVKVNGVDVGRVKVIAIDKNNPYRVIVNVTIDKNIPITKDMYAVLQGQGLTGLRYINIIGGKSKEYIVANSKESIIPSKKSYLSILKDKAPQLLDKANSILNEKNLKNIDLLLENTATLTKKAIALEDNIYKLLGESNKSKHFTVSEFISSLRDVNSTLLEYKKLARDGQKTFKVVNSKLPLLLNSVNKSAKSLKVTANMIQRSIKRGDYNLKRILSPAVIDINILSNRYQELADEIEALVQNPTAKLLNGKTLQKGPGE